MNTSILYAVMVCAGLLMAVLPFGIFLGIGTLMGIPSSNIGLKIAYMLGLLAVTYGVSFGSFALIQKSNCGEIKNTKQIALNSLIPMLFNAFLVILVVFIPWFRNVIGNLTPPTMDLSVRDSISYSYYAFWGTVLGIALGGTMSASCGKDTFLLETINKALTEAPTAPVSDENDLDLSLSLPPS
jgi:hypothetical protein